MSHYRYIAIVIALLMVSACVTPKEENVAVVKANKDPKYSSLRKGTRYAIFVADKDIKRTDATTEIEDRIKSALSDRGLVLVDFDQKSLANYLRNDGTISEKFAKQISASVDLVVTGRIREEHLIDSNINNSGTYRTRISLSVAVTESNSAIEKSRQFANCEQLASSFESAAVHAAVECGDKVAAELIEKLLYIYEE